LSGLGCGGLTPISSYASAVSFEGEPGQRIAQLRQFGHTQPVTSNEAQKWLFNQAKNICAAYQTIAGTDSGLKSAGLQVAPADSSVVRTNDARLGGPGGPLHSFR
jgi:hypothetical protein